MKSGRSAAQKPRKSTHNGHLANGHNVSILQINTILYIDQITRSCSHFGWWDMRQVPILDVGIIDMPWLHVKHNPCIEWYSFGKYSHCGQGLRSQDGLLSSEPWCECSWDCKSSAPSSKPWKTWTFWWQKKSSSQVRKGLKEVPWHADCFQWCRS